MNFWNKTDQYINEENTKQIIDDGNAIENIILKLLLSTIPSGVFYYLLME